MIRTLIFVLVAEIWNTLGQVLFKKATHGLEGPARKQDYAVFIRKILKRPEIGLGLLSMAIGLIAWLAALSNADLNIVFPLGSLQYILILFASRFFLSEKIDAPRALGTLFIAGGIVLIAQS